MLKSISQGKVGLLSTTVVLAVLAGCQPPAAVVKNDESTNSVGKPGTAAQQPAAQTPQKPPAALGDTQKSPSEADQANQEAPKLNPEGLAVVDLAKPVLIKASEGGTYVSEDGLLTATIPPGALSQDTVVKFARLDTSGEKNTNQRLSGIRFQMDIGDAYIMPGQKISVASKADERLIPELQQMYSDYTPERYALSQDAKGNWVVTMPVAGPAAQPLDRTKTYNDPYLTERRGIMTEGAAPIPAGKGGNFKKDARIEAFCNYYPPPPPKPQHWMWAMCRWASDDPALDGKPAYDGNSAYNTYVRFGNATAASVSGVNGYWVKEKVPGHAAVAEVSHQETATSSDANGIKTDKGNTFKYSDLGITAANMAKYDNELFFAAKAEDATGNIDDAAKDLASDRVSVDKVKSQLKIKVIDQAAQPAVADSTVDKFVQGWIDLTASTNEDVRSGYNWNGYCYCNWTVYRDKIVYDTSPQPVGADGKAWNLVRETFTISAQGQTYNPNPTPAKYPGAGIGTVATRTITAGDNGVNLTVPKYSPMFGCTLNSPDLKMEGDFTITVNISGVGDRTYTFSSNGSNSMPLNFRMLLPDDEQHTMSFKEVRFLNGQLIGKGQSIEAIKNVGIRRNGIYDGYTIEIIPTGAK